MKKIINMCCILIFGCTMHSAQLNHTKIMTRAVIKEWKIRIEAIKTQDDFTALNKSFREISVSQDAYYEIANAIKEQQVKIELNQCKNSKVLESIVQEMLQNKDWKPYSTFIKQYAHSLKVQIVDMWNTQIQNINTLKDFFKIAHNFEKDKDLMSDDVYNEIVLLLDLCFIKNHFNTATTIDDVTTMMHKMLRHPKISKYSEEIKKAANLAQSSLGSLKSLE